MSHHENETTSSVDVATALRSLPNIEPDSQRVARWTKAAIRDDAPAQRRNVWVPTALAAGLLLSVFAARYIAAPASVETEDSVAQSTSEPNDQLQQQPDLPTYVAQSALLEQVLARLPSEGRVRSVSDASAIASLEDRLAFIDNVIANPTDAVTGNVQTQLWRERVGLMNTLVNLKQGDSATVWL